MALYLDYRTERQKQVLIHFTSLEGRCRKEKEKRGVKAFVISRGLIGRKERMLDEVVEEDEEGPGGMHSLQRSQTPHPSSPSLVPQDISVGAFVETLGL